MMNAFWASENFDAFIAVHSSQPGKTEAKVLAQNERDFRDRINMKPYKTSMWITTGSYLP
jgi:hypothetical protein